MAVPLSKLPFTFSDRTLFSHVVSRTPEGLLTPVHLEAVRDKLRTIGRLQNPVDVEQTLDHLAVRFTAGHMEAALKCDEQEQLGPDRLLFTNAGAQHVAKEVLPARFFHGLKKLAKLNPRGAELASETWNLFARSQEHVADTPRMLRTVRARLADGTVRRLVRSSHSPDYAVYSNIGFVEDMLANAGEFAHMPVLDARVTDNALRLRFAGIDGGMAAFMHFDAQVLTTEPIPVIEAWNSETGQSKTRLRAGAWRFDSRSYISHWSRKSEHEWIHRGSSDRIRAGVSLAFEELAAVAQAVVAAFKEAEQIALEDPALWLAQQLHSFSTRVSESTIAAIQAALKDKRVAKEGSLASAIDAVALVAQGQVDIFEQADIETLASKLLQLGLEQAKKHGGIIPVTE